MSDKTRATDGAIDTSASAQPYPLFCWDSGDRYSESRYCGPFDTHAEARARLEAEADPRGHLPPWLLRRCRRLGVGDIIDGLRDIVEDLDLWVNEGNLGESAWARYDDEIVTARGPEADLWATLIKALDPHLKIDAFVCEGDEAHPGRSRPQG